MTARTRQGPGLGGKGRELPRTRLLGWQRFILGNHVFLSVLVINVGEYPELFHAPDAMPDADAQLGMPCIVVFILLAQGAFFGCLLWYFQRSSQITEIAQNQYTWRLVYTGLVIDTLVMFAPVLGGLNGQNALVAVGDNLVRYGVAR